MRGYPDPADEEEYPDPDSGLNVPVRSLTPVPETEDELVDSAIGSGDNGENNNNDPEDNDNSDSTPKDDDANQEEDTNQQSGDDPEVIEESKPDDKNVEEEIRKDDSDSRRNNSRETLDGDDQVQMPRYDTQFTLGTVDGEEVIDFEEEEEPV